MRYSTPAAILSVVLIAGCTTTSQDQFETTQKQLVTNRALRKEVEKTAVSKCATELVFSKTKMDAMAALLNSNPARLTHDLCDRIIRYYASGKMTYTDYRSMVEGHLTAKTVRIIQGKL